MLEWTDSIKLCSLGGTANLMEGLEEAISADKVKGLGEVNEMQCTGASAALCTSLGVDGGRRPCLP